MNSLSLKKKLVTKFGILEFASALLTGGIIYAIFQNLSLAAAAAISVTATIAIVRLAQRLRQMEVAYTNLSSNLKSTASDLVKLDKNATHMATKAKAIEEQVTSLKIATEAKAIEEQVTSLIKVSRTIQANQEEFTENLDNMAKRIDDITVEKTTVENYIKSQNTNAERIETLIDRAQSIEDETDRIRVGVRNISRNKKLPADFHSIRSFDPEIDILPILRAHSESNRAIDVGAHKGEFSAALRKLNFEVDAFEPIKELATEIKKIIGKDKNFRIHTHAVGAKQSKTPLYKAKAHDKFLDTSLFTTLSKHPTYNGIDFEEVGSIQVKSLDSVLAKEGLLEVALLKSDTEGHELAVLHGAQNICAENLLLEFWDQEFVFNMGKTKNRLDDYLVTIDRQKLPYYIVMWRGRKRHEFGFGANIEKTPNASWGNVLFMSKKSTMDAVLKWATKNYGPSWITGGETNEDG